jgi:hypothetical protein
MLGMVPGVVSPAHAGQSLHPRESRTIRIMDVDEPIEEIDVTPTRQERKTGPCELCGRPGQSLTFHHLIPRHCHRKKRFRSRFSLQEMRSRGLWICRLCHGGIHDLIPDEKDLGWNYPTREQLLAHEGVRKHIDWVRRQR